MNVLEGHKTFQRPSIKIKTALKAIIDPQMTLMDPQATIKFFYSKVMLKALSLIGNHQTTFELKSKIIESHKTEKNNANLRNLIQISILKL